jgi:septal ring factor EnvC (AmiA/AmiB activator)
MAKKKSIEEMKAELAALDQRIEDGTKKLAKLRQSRQTLKSEIDTAELFEIKGLLDERQLTYEQAKDILNKANPVLSKPDQNV